VTGRRSSRDADLARRAGETSGRVPKRPPMPKRPATPAGDRPISRQTTGTAATSGTIRGVAYPLTPTRTRASAAPPPPARPGRRSTDASKAPRSAPSRSAAPAVKRRSAPRADARSRQAATVTRLHPGGSRRRQRPARPETPKPAGRTPNHKRRLQVIFGIAACAGAALLARVVDVQGLSASKYAAYGNSELYRKVTLPALRGTVYDRNGNILATSVPRVDVVADDYLVPKTGANESTLAKVLGITPSKLQGLLGQKDGYVTLARQVSSSVQTSVADLNLPYVNFVPDPQRDDPDGTLFTPLLGQVGFDGTGLSGLEYDQQRLLSGTAGSEEVAAGPAGQDLPGGPQDVVAAKQGAGLVLTLDQSLQFEVTKVLAAQILKTHSNSGTVVVLDTKTGGVLAMVNLQKGPKGTVVPAEQDNAVTSVYQAGSVMKLATISGALQQHLITPTSVFTIPYTIYVGGWPFQDADYHPTEQLPVAQILAQSSNVGTIEIAHLLGPQLLYHYLWDLGYGQKTDLNWPGESAGLLPALNTWPAADMGTIPIGTGEAVTPMQIVDAYNAVANGGLYGPPRLVQATVSPSGAQHVLPMAKTHRVLDASTVRELLPMLELVTSDGTAIAAQVPGYTVAGKTGTAQIPGDGGYIPGAWMATFVGFVPAQNPQLTAIVVLNHPDDYYGGVASAPVFSEIMSYALRHFDVSPPSTGASQP
jgi:cell division protein FtsI (penicillin-binding protein 3)